MDKLKARKVSKVCKSKFDQCPLGAEGFILGSREEKGGGTERDGSRWRLQETDANARECAALVVTARHLHQNSIRLQFRCYY